MISCYKVRVDTQDVDKFKLFLDKYSDVNCYCHEHKFEDNPHCHAYMETTAKQGTLRNRIRKDFGSGNGSYSMKEVEKDPVEYIAYMMKDGDFCAGNIAESLLREAQEYDLKVKTQIKEKKKSRKTVMEQMIEKFNYDEVPPQDRCQVVTDVVAFYKDERKLVREFAMVSQVQTLLLRYIPAYANDLEAVIHKKLVL